VLQLVSGADLQERIARGPMPVDEVIDVAVQTCDALAAAHAAGIVHRDLKPSNIRLDASGAVKVLDFGLAKAWQQRAPTRDTDVSCTPTRVPEATAAGMMLGTAAYMAPEQARGSEVDNRSDIWSFGVVLWEMLAGAPPFRGATVADLIAAVLREEPPWERLPSHVPDGLRRLLRRCLRRDPARRLHHIIDARIELEEAREPSPRTSAATATPTRTTARTWTLSSELCRRFDRAHLDLMDPDMIHRHTEALLERIAASR
jgi:serine/threonine protein kinase